MQSVGFAMALVLVLFAGCGIMTSALPDPVAFAAANAADFVPDLSIELAGVQPGTVVDSIDGLDGCWASARIDADGEVWLLDVLMFDGDSGTIVLWHAQPGPSGLRVVGGGEGAYMVLAEASIQLSESLEFYLNLFTGVLERNVIDPPIETSVNVTIDGDRMLFERFEPGVELDIDPDLFFLMYRRFACPVSP